MHQGGEGAGGQVKKWFFIMQEGGVKVEIFYIKYIVAQK